MSLYEHIMGDPRCMSLDGQQYLCTSPRACWQGGARGRGRARCRTRWRRSRPAWESSTSRSSWTGCDAPRDTPSRRPRALPQLQDPHAPLYSSFCTETHARAAGCNPGGRAADAERARGQVPRTASNFIDLAQSGFYDGLHFHRVIPVRQAPSPLLPSSPVLPSLFGCAAGTTRRHALPLSTA